MQAERLGGQDARSAFTAQIELLYLPGQGQRPAKNKVFLLGASEFFEFGTLLSRQNGDIESKRQTN